MIEFPQSEEITEPESSDKNDFNGSITITAEPSLNGLDLPDKVPQSSKDVSNIPPVETEVTKSSAQRAYEQLEERRREVLSRRLEEKASASSTDNTEVKNKTGLPIRVSSIRPFLKQRKDPKPMPKENFLFPAEQKSQKKKEMKWLKKLKRISANKIPLTFTTDFPFQILVNMM